MYARGGRDVSETSTKHVSIRKSSQPDVDRRQLLPMDRAQAAQFVLKNADRIRDVARRHLSRHARMQGGSDDIVSSVLRRVDEMASRDLLRPRSDAELWRLIRQITYHTAASYSREMARLYDTVKEAAVSVAPHTSAITESLNAQDAAELVTDILARLRQEGLHHMFILRAKGVSHPVIAQFLGISADAGRQRWSSACRTIAEVFQERAGAQQ